MVELVDLLKLKRKKVTHVLNGGDTSIEIMGLSGPEYFQILDRFPPVAALFLGGQANIFDAVKSIPGALAAWAAAACGYAGNADAEKAAMDELTLEEVTALVEASMAQTFSKGFDTYLIRQGRILGNLVQVPAQPPNARAIAAPTEEVAPTPAQTEPPEVSTVTG